MCQKCPKDIKTFIKKQGHIWKEHYQICFKKLLNFINLFFHESIVTLFYAPYDKTQVSLSQKKTFLLKKPMWQLPRYENLEFPKLTHPIDDYHVSLIKRGSDINALQALNAEKEKISVIGQDEQVGPVWFTKYLWLVRMNIEQVGPVRISKYLWLVRIRGEHSQTKSNAQSDNEKNNWRVKVYKKC